MVEPVTPEAEHDPHFVGWLPMPRAYSRLLAPVAVAMIAAAGAVAGVLALGQRSPGDGRWDVRATTLEGIAYAEPYPMVRVPGDRPGDPPATVLLVGEGKLGAKDRTRPFDGLPVRVTGTVLGRDGWRVLELASEDGLRATELPESEQVRLRRAAPRPLGRAALRGEIVDAKCFLGAMKPGGGRAHRGCAVLCLRGGIPPLFVSQGGGGRTTYLLTGDDRGPIDESLLDLAGLPVLIEASAEALDDLAVLRVTRSGVRVE